MRRIVLPLLLFVRCSIVELIGTIGKDLHISMNLTFQKDGLSGSYTAVKYEKNISFPHTPNPKFPSLCNQVVAAGVFRRFLARFKSAARAVVTPIPSSLPIERQERPWSRKAAIL